MRMKKQLMIGVILFLSVGSGLVSFLHAENETPNEESIVRVMSYNIHRGGEGTFEGTRHVAEDPPGSPSPEFTVGILTVYFVSKRK